MLSDKVQRSMKELNTLMSAYHECLSWAIEACVEEDDLSVIETLLDEHVRSYIFL